MDESSGSGEHGEEQVEWIDDVGRLIAVVPRSRMRARNLRHRSVAVIVRSGDGRLLVHERSSTKDVFPGWWDVCVGGVVAAGETVDEAARRELAEEIGVCDVVPERIAVERFDDESARELCTLYRVVHDGPYAFADGEVTCALLVDRTRFGELFQRHRFLPGSLAMALPHVPGFDPR